MINYAYEDLFKQTSIPKQLKIYYGNSVLTNEELEYEKFEMQEYLCAKEQLQFGVGGSVCVKFSVGYGIDPLEGEEIRITITPQGGTELDLGTFYVTSDKPTADRRHRNIIAYDFIGTILNLNVIDWYNTLFSTDTTTKTVKQIRDSLFTYLGIVQETVTLPRDNVVIGRTVSGNELTAGDVLNAICEMNFRFGYMTRDNKFRYVELQPIGEVLYPEEELYPADDLYPAEGEVDEEIGVGGNYISADYEDYYTEPIDKFQIRTEENDIGYIEGTGTNAYIIENNFLLYGKSTAELQTDFAGALSYLEQIYFTPANIQAQGNPCLEVGDRIRLHTQYAIIDTYILQRNLKGIQGLRDTYVSESPRLRSEQLNSVNHSLIALQGKTNTLDRTIEETRLEVADLDVGLTAVTIKADGLEVRVDDIARELDGETLYYERESGAPTLLNYPAWDFTISIPCDGTMQLGDGIPFLYTTGYNTYAEHKRDLCVDLSTGEGYRFLIENGVYVWKAIEGSDWSVLYNQISDLRVDVDSIDLEVSNTEVTVANHETRITQNTASINTQASQITAKVNSTDHNASNTFGWDLTTAGFDVKANGTSVFKVNSSGAEVKGKITSQSGQIANMQITATGFTYGADAGISPSGYYGNNEIKIYGNYVRITDVSATPERDIFYGGGSGDFTTIRAGADIYLFPRYGLFVKSDLYGILASMYSTAIEFRKQVKCESGLVVTGTKSREIETKDYGNRLLYCLETPSPMFEDIGEGKIASDGKCYINIDSTFSETIQTAQYQVFLQCYGNGNAYVSERHSTYFVVEGTEGLNFGWRIVAKQIDYTNLRLEQDFGKVDMEQKDYGYEGINHIDKIIKERQVVL